MDNSDSYLFEVGALTIAFAGTPVSDTALGYVREAVKGDIQGIVPTSALIGSYHVLRRRYNFPPNRAENIVTNLLDSNRIKWHDEIRVEKVREGLETARRESIEGWDGYYIETAKEWEATILTTDKGLKEIRGLNAELVLENDEFEILTEYMKEEGLIRGEEYEN